MEIRRQRVPRGDEALSTGVQGGRRRVVSVQSRMDAGSADRRSGDQPGDAVELSASGACGLQRERQGAGPGGEVDVWPAIVHGVLEEEKRQLRARIRGLELECETLRGPRSISRERRTGEDPSTNYSPV